MANTSTEPGQMLVLVGDSGGRALISAGSPLTRLNYFDGKFLRAEDLRVEQEYMRRLVHASNRAGGWGVVHGLDVALRDGDRLRVDAGMAVDGRGRILLLPQAADVSIPDLVDAARGRGNGSATRAGSGGATEHGEFEPCELPAFDGEETEGLPLPGLYLVTAMHAEALCGEEDVYGRLCEQACITETDRPYRVEGVLLRVRPLTLRTPLAHSGAVPLDDRHLRALVASAYFADEARTPASLISGEGLRLSTWCGGAAAGGRDEVPLGVLARDGETTRFLDAWIARRERIDPPPRRYWAGRLAMRPHNVFLAHLLQFQCQLAEALGDAPVDGGNGADDDACADERAALEAAWRGLEAVEARLEDAAATEEEWREVPEEIRHLLRMKESLARVLETPDAGRTRRNGARRVLLDRGIVELPSAGYLPVDPRAGDVEMQVRTLLGEGVDLRVCVVRPDFVPHALEEARHMDRISLLRGLDDASDRPEVDVLVPDGRIVTPEARARRVYDVELEITPPAEAFEDDDRRGDELAVPVRGAARAERVADGGALHFAASPLKLPEPVASLLWEWFADAADDLLGDRVAVDGEADGVTNLRTGAWLTVHFDGDPFALSPGGGVRCSARLALAFARRPATTRVDGALEMDFEGRLVAAEVERPEEGGADGGESRFRGSFPRLQGVLAPSLNGRSGDFEGRFLQLDVSAELGRDDAGRDRLEFTISPPNEDFEFAAVARWADRRASGQVVARVPAEDGAGGTTVKPIDGGSTVQGRVIDAETGQPLPGVQVVIPQINRGALTDQDGRFQLLDLPDDRITVAVSMIGYRDASVELDMTGGAGWSVTFELMPDTLEHREIRLAEMKAEDTARVLDPTDPAHRAAVNALDLLAAALGEAGFRAEAERTLFAAREAPRAPVVRATRDWVLFHRRRRKECADEPPRSAPPATRTYAVHHLALAPDGDLAEMLERAQRSLEAGDFVTAVDLVNAVRNSYGAPPVNPTTREEIAEAIEDEERRLHRIALERLRERLAAGDPDALAGLEPVAVGPARFPATGATPLDDAALLRQRWAAAGPAETLVFGAVAGRGEALADGPALAERRVARLMDVLESVTPRSSDAGVVSLPQIPAGLDPDGGDGVMLLITGPPAPEEEDDAEVGTDCHDLGRLVAPRRRVEAILKEFRIVGPSADPFARAEFRAGTTELRTDSAELRRAWTAAGDGTVREVWGVGQAQGSMDLAQAEAVGRLFGPAETVRGFAEMPTGEPCVRTELVVLADDHRVLAVDDLGNARTAGDVANAINQMGVEQATAMWGVVDLGPHVLFDADTTTLLGGLEDVTSAWEALGDRFGPDLRYGIVTATPGSPDGAFAEQTATIADALGVEPETDAIVPAPHDDGFDGAAAVTLILAFGSVIG